MKKIGNTQSGTLLVEMTEVEYEKLTVLRDLPVELGQGQVGHFAAIGNHNLLKASSILQVQCSRG